MIDTQKEANELTDLLLNKLDPQSGTDQDNSPGHSINGPKGSPEVTGKTVGDHDASGDTRATGTPDRGWLPRWDWRKQRQRAGYR